MGNKETGLSIAWPDIRNKIIYSFIFGLAVITVLAVYADLPQMLNVLGRFMWGLLPFVLGLTLFNYVLRFIKWHYYLVQFGAGDVRLMDSLAIFPTGFTMVMTPGKLGELFKSYLLRRTSDVPMSRSAPVVLAKRLTDGLAMFILALAGLVMYRYGWQLLLIALAAMALVIILVQFRPLALLLLSWQERLPLVSRFGHSFSQFYESSYRLLSPKNLFIAVALGVVSWGAEGVALYLILLGLGFLATPLLLLQAVFALASSVILGALSFLPGGLGVVDASLAGVLLFLTDATRDKAVAATLLIRFCTLWFGVALGLLVLLLYRRRFFQEGVSSDND